MKKIAVQKAAKSGLGKAGAVGHDCDLHDCIGEGCPSLGKASKVDQLVNQVRTLNVAKVKQRRNVAK